MMESSNNSLSQETKTFLAKVIEYAESVDGKEGLSKMETEDGQREYMAKYIEANRKTVDKVLSMTSSQRREMAVDLSRSLWKRFN